MMEESPRPGTGYTGGHAPDTESSAKRHPALAKRLSLLVCVLLVLAFLAGAALVAVVDPVTGALTGDPEFEAVLSKVIGDNQAPVLWFRPGYVVDYTVTTGESKERIRVVRGPLDRKAGTFLLSLTYFCQGRDDLENVRLKITTESDWDPESTPWISLGKPEIAEKDGWAVATVEGNAPADTTAFAVTGAQTEDRYFVRTQSIPRSPTRLGRIHDSIGAWPLFSWVPKLR